MTQDIDLNNIITKKEKLPEFREELEMKIKDIFIWALGEAAVTEMTKTVRDTDKQNEYQPIVCPIQTPFYTRKK